MTVKELIIALLEASELDDPVYVETPTGHDVLKIEKTGTKAYYWGFVIGRIQR